MERTTRGLWLEIIKVQSTEDTDRRVRELIDALKLEPAVRKSKDVRVFSSETGDLAIHILWESSQIPHDGSSVGLRLAAALSEYGLISHTIWTEEV